MKKIFWVFFVFLLLAGQSFAAVNDPADIKAVEAAAENVRQAMLKVDLAAFDKLFAPDLIYVHASGGIDNIDVFKQKLAEKDSYKSIDIGNQVVTTTENSAIVTHIFECNVISKGTNNDQPFNVHVGVMQVWKKTGDEWRLSARKSFNIPF